MPGELEQIKNTQREQGVTLEAQNTALADLGSSVGGLREEIQKLRGEIKPMTDLYNGGAFLKNFTMGFSAFVGSVLTIGAAIWMIINAVKHL